MRAQPRPPEIESADYHYPTSRHPYASRAADYPDHLLLNERTEHYRGRWRSHLAQVLGHPIERLVVEVGTNGGHVLIPQAARAPRSAFLGIDWKYKQVYLGAQKASGQGVRNAFFLRAHAGRIGFMFDPGEIDELWLYFPDPWPKRAHHKHRWLQTKRFDEVHALLNRGGIFDIRTDHPGYFEAMLAALSQARAPWRELVRSWDRHALLGAEAKRLVPPEVTLFERIFVRQGLPIHALRLQKP